MFENVDGRTDDGRTDDGRTDAGVTGILIAHLGAFGSGELKITHFPGQKRAFTHGFFSLKMYRKSSLFIHSTESLISFILFRRLVLFWSS